MTQGRRADPESAVGRLESHRHEALHPELDRWRENVGDVLALDYAEPASTPLAGLRVLCWNLAIGRAHLAAVLARLEQGDIPGCEPDPARPLVILAQEVYRTDESVPELLRGRHHGGLQPREPRESIGELAEAHRLSVRYAPSMRNGRHRSDRGNAILATTPLIDAAAFLLPHARQRRVVVSARLELAPHVRVAAAHLDTRRSLRRPGRGSPLRQARTLAAELLAFGDTFTLLGADLNSYLGLRDGNVRALLGSGFRLATRVGAWRHTFHTPRLRLALDHVLYHCPPELPVQVRVHRLDEHPRDAGTWVFGSDHHPLLADVRFG